MSKLQVKPLEIPKGYDLLYLEEGINLTDSHIYDRKSKSWRVHEDLEEEKTKLLEQARSTCAFLIQSFLPVYKQLNLLRENPADVRFVILDNLRLLSNEIEGKIRACNTIKKLRQVDVDGAFQSDKRMRDKDGKFIPDNPDTFKVNEAYKTGQSPSKKKATPKKKAK